MPDPRPKILPAGDTASLPQAYALADRSGRVQALGEAVADGIASLVADLGLDAHELVAVTVTAIDAFARHRAEPGSRAQLLRLLARQVERRAAPHARPRPPEQPLGKTFGEIQLLQVLSRLLADVAAARKLSPEAGAAFGEPTLQRARRLLGEAGFRYCRTCGCSDYDACLATEGRQVGAASVPRPAPGIAEGTPCHWVEDDLCSRCAGGNHPGSA